MCVYFFKLSDDVKLVSDLLDITFQNKYEFNNCTFIDDKNFISEFSVEEKLDYLGFFDIYEFIEFVERKK